MSKSQVSIKIKGHESFYVREGWLRKGLVAVNEDEGTFINEFATDTLGIGANMVKSLRYWLQVVGLTEEYTREDRKRAQRLTEYLGKVILENDPYFEDVFSLWILQYKLASNFSQATSWYLFFNRLKATELDKEALFNTMIQLLKNIDVNISVSEKSLKDDCACIIKTYCLDDNDLKNPEDNLISPFTELGLLKKKIENHKEVFEIVKPEFEKLDKLAVLYVIIDNMRKGNIKNTTIDRLLDDECNVGKVFNLDKNSINEYLDLLEKEELIEVNRTAGLNTIYLKEELTTKMVLEKYYNSSR